MRKTPLRPSSRGLSRQGRKLKPVNQERQAKREARRKVIRQSPHTKRIRKERLALCGGQCEFVAILRYDAELDRNIMHRCENRDGEPLPLQMHHRTYMRFGSELIDDVRMFCKWHHEHVERTEYSHRKRNKYQRRSA